MKPSILLSRLREHRLFETVSSLFSFSASRMREAQLQEVASSMTLTTLLSLVPLLAVSLAAFAAFPSFADTRKALEDALFNSFLPDQYSTEIMEYLKLFSDHASGLGAFGLAGLSLTALLMINKFFVTVNRIFRVKNMRPWTQRAMIYWALLTLGPLAIALSITFTTQAIRIASGSTDISVPGWLFVVLQLLLQTFGYAVLFKLVPNCRVPFSHAFAGGLIVAVASQIVKMGFEYYITAGTLSSIYGAFVAFPVFLLWLYVAWMLVFAGAAITATIPQLTSGRFADSYMRGNDFLTGTVLLAELTRARQKGQPVVSVDELARAADSYPQAIERILARLAEYDYCAPVLESERRRRTGWALLCDPEKRTLRDAVFALLIDPANGLVRPAGDARHPEGPLSAWFSRFTEASIIDEPLSELADPGRAKALAKAVSEV
ncbi:YihY family inner membrane protein [Sutterella sp.]|uniref:YihY family inner membrane protein n=1 Tax=Sutterella sp. TaxID=1981025 RepID=UPI0026DFB3F0|nr:YihY family inner membrane protein [Sutterella sp.]MDO5530977.1 YihY family inner membrane protein [Sutterella sp.]